MNTNPQYGVSLYPADESKALRHRLFVSLTEAERFYNGELQRLNTLREYWSIVLWRSVHHPEGAGDIRQAEYNAQKTIPAEVQGRLW